MQLMQLRAQRENGQRTEQRAAYYRRIAARALAEVERLKAEVKEYSKRYADWSESDHPRHETETFIYAGRPLTPAEKRVDFAAIKKMFDEDALAVGLKLRAMLKATRDAALKLVEQQEAAGLSADFAASIRLDVGQAFAKAVENYLMDVWRRNRDMAIAELPENVQKKIAVLKRFASAYKPDVAANYFRARSYFIKGIVDEDLTKKVKFEVFQHLKNGRGLSETLGNIREVLEPWVGDPSKIAPSGITRTAADILAGYRIENIIRTESADSMAEGRRAVAEAADDFVIGYELSPIDDDRNSVTCEFINDNGPIRFKTNDPRAVKLMPPLHWQCRTVPIFVTTNDVPVEWTDEATLDELVRLIPQEFK